MISGFDIGPFHIQFYGIIIMSGVIAAAWLSDREARRRGQNHEFVWDALVWVVIGGVIGARLWHLLTPPASMIEQGITPWYYLTHPLDAIAIWRGGLGIPGAVIGGALALYWYTRRAGLSFAVWADIVVPGLALAQAIGRWGNFFNQELYGAPTTLPWAIYIDPLHRLPEYAQYEYYHPLFLYESLWNLANALFLLWLGRRFAQWLKPGDLFLTYLITYPVARFFLEFLRLDPSPVAGLNVNQTLMLACVVFGAGALFMRHHEKT